MSHGHNRQSNEMKKYDIKDSDAYLFYLHLRSNLVWFLRSVTNT